MRPVFSDQARFGSPKELSRNAYSSFRLGAGVFLRTDPEHVVIREQTHRDALSAQRTPTHERRAFACLLVGKAKQGQAVAKLGSLTPTENSAIRGTTLCRELFTRPRSALVRVTRILLAHRCVPFTTSETKAAQAARPHTQATKG